MPGGAEEEWKRQVDSKKDEPMLWRITKESRDGRSFSYYLRQWTIGPSAIDSKLISAVGDYSSLADAQEKAKFTEVLLLTIDDEG